MRQSVTGESVENQVIVVGLLPMFREVILNHYLSGIIERIEPSISVNLVFTLVTLDLDLSHTLFWHYTRITVLWGVLRSYPP